MKLVKAWESRAFRKTLVSAGLGLLAVLPILLGSGRVAAQEPASCLSPNPAAWPPAARPYFMLAVDTSGSMIGCTNPSGTQYDFPDSCPNTATPNSCGLEPTRLNDAKCALRKTVQAFAGEVNFGMATFAINLSGCGNSACGDSCTNARRHVRSAGRRRHGRRILFWRGMQRLRLRQRDPRNFVWQSARLQQHEPTHLRRRLAKRRQSRGRHAAGSGAVDTARNAPASNVSTLLEWFDGQCNGSRELFAIGSTPLEGILRTVHQYLAAGWSTGWADGNYCTTGGPAITNASPINAGEDPTCRASSMSSWSPTVTKRVAARQPALRPRSGIRA